MKKFIKISLILLLFSQFSLAENLNYAKQDEILNEEFFEQPVLLEEDEKPKEENENNEKFLETKLKSKDILKGIIEKDYNLNSPFGMFQEQLTLKFEKGPIKEHWSELMMIHNFSENIDSKKGSNFNYGIVPINFGLFGKFRSEKEKYFIVMDATPDNHNNFMKSLVLDAWVESDRIPNHKIKVGKFRPMVGYEGNRSNFLVPFSSKSQIARHFSNARKTGVSISGDFKYFDYSLEGFNSDIQYEDFLPGVEGVIWGDIKPLANVKEKYGNLKIGGGYQAGRRNSQNYNVSSAGLKYDYKKFSLVSELAYADGSNGTTGLTNTKRFGYNVTLAYKLTKKLELLLRYDDFDNDTKIKNNNTKEYTAGFNYYILGQTLRLIGNYVYSKKDGGDDSHKIILGTQIAF